MTTIFTLIVVSFLTTTSNPSNVIQVTGFQTLANCEREAAKIKSMMVRTYRSADHVCVQQDFSDEGG